MSTYAILQADIASWLARESLTAQIPSFIRLAEDKMARELRIQPMMRRQRANGNDTQYLSLPVNYLDMRRLKLIGGGSGLTDLEQVSPDALKPRSNGGDPQVFTVHRELEFDAPLALASEVEMVFYAPVEALSDLAPSNWLSLNSYDSYLYGSLLAAEAFLKNDERLGVWKTGYDNSIALLNRTDERSRVSRSGQRLSMRAVSTP